MENKIKIPMKMKLIIAMKMEGVILYTFFSSIGISLMSFSLAGYSIFSLFALVSAILSSAFLSVSLFLMSYWQKLKIKKEKEIVFPFLPVILPDFDIEIIPLDKKKDKK
jgi:hypothetical protein